MCRAAGLQGGQHGEGALGVLDQRRSEGSIILVTGEEATGRTTTIRALLAESPGAVKLDPEEVGQVNSFVFGPSFLQLLQDNVCDVITNFWAAGYRVVITGSFPCGDTHFSFRRFQAQLPEDVSVYLVHLRASKAVRDRRRIDRDKPSTEELREQVDASYPRDDDSLRHNALGCRYIIIDNSNQQLAETVADIKAAIPEVYARSS